VHVNLSKKSHSTDCSNASLSKKINLVNRFNGFWFEDDNALCFVNQPGQLFQFFFFTNTQLFLRFSFCMNES